MKYAVDGVYELLKDLVSNQVFVMKAPDNTKGDFIVIQKTDSTRWRSIKAPSGIAQANIQVDSYSNTFYTARDIASQVEVILDGFRGTVSYGGSIPQDTIKIGGISLQNDIDLIEQEEEDTLYRVSASYLVTYEQE